MNDKNYTKSNIVKLVILVCCIIGGIYWLETNEFKLAPKEDRLFHDLRELTETYAKSQDVIPQDETRHYLSNRLDIWGGQYITVIQWNNDRMEVYTFSTGEDGRPYSNDDIKSDVLPCKKWEALQKK